MLLKKRRWIVIIDGAAHLTCGFVLPGYWLFCFIPDTFLPFVLYISFKTNRLAPADNLFVRAFNFFHMLYLPCFLLISSWGLRNWFLFGMSVQWLAHIGVDLFTHPEQQLKKKLW
jgi:hypothetical protein